MPRMSPEDACKYAFHMFGKELDHESTAKAMEIDGNVQDMRESQERADSFLDSGWKELENHGWRPRDIAKFRHESRVKWAQLYPMDVHKLTLK